MILETPHEEYKTALFLHKKTHSSIVIQRLFVYFFAAKSYFTSHLSSCQIFKLYEEKLACQQNV